MIPGMPGGRVNPKQMDAMMKRLGINVEEIEGIEEVVIRTATEELVFKDASVTVMKAQGTTTYQLTGTPTRRAKAGVPPPKTAEQQLAEVQVSISDEDVAFVAQQTGRPKPEAKKALEAANGDIAEAILRLTNE